MEGEIPCIHFMHRSGNGLPSHSSVRPLEEAGLWLAYTSNVFLAVALLFTVSAAITSKPSLRPFNLFHADLKKKHLVKANFQWTDARRAHLQGSYLEEADLSDAELSDANLQGAKLSGAILHRAKLNGANLQCADLTSTKLGEAELNGTQVHFVDLSKAIGLTQKQIYQSCVNKQTKLPKGMKRPTPCEHEKYQKKLSCEPETDVAD